MKESKQQWSFGGWASIVGGGLFLVRALLEWWAGAPPMAEGTLLEWVRSNKILLASCNELLFFASLCWLPLALALYERFAKRTQSAAGAGAVVLVLMIPITLMAAVIQGRLFYPIYGVIAADHKSAALVMISYYGTIHMLALLVAVAVLFLSWAFRAEARWRGLSLSGVIVAFSAIAWSFPDAIGPTWALACQVPFGLWLITVGVRLLSPVDL